MADRFQHRGVGRDVAGSTGSVTARTAFAASLFVMVLAAFLAAGQDHLWSVGHRWLDQGGFETVTSLVTFALAACCLSASFVSKHSGEIDAGAFRLKARARFAAMPDPSLPGVNPGKPLTAREFLAMEGASDHDDVQSVLAEQLGPRFASGDGPGSLPLHLRCLVVCLTARSKDREALVRAVSQAWDGPNADARLRELCDPLIDRSWLEVREVLSRHDRYRTGMLALADRARVRGQLVSARLHWLRRDDPVLWQAVCDLGRPTCHPIALALLIQYRAEVEAGGPTGADMSVAARMLLDAADPKRSGRP